MVCVVIARLHSENSSILEEFPFKETAQNYLLNSCAIFTFPAISYSSYEYIQTNHFHFHPLFVILPLKTRMNTISTLRHAHIHKLKSKEKDYCVYLSNFYIDSMAVECCIIGLREIHTYIQRFCMYVCMYIYIGWMIDI